jgi:drug/metabolite transporter (DMT)-like permease
MNGLTSRQNAAAISRPDNLTLLAYGFTVLFAGSNFVAVRFTVAELPPFWGATIRFAAAALIFWGIVLLRRSPFPGRRTLLGILLFGFLSIGASYAFLYWGIQSIPAGLTSVFIALAPLMTLFFAFFHGIEPFRWRGLMGGVLAMAGIGYAFFEQPGETLPVIPVLAIIAGVACIAESTVVIKMIPKSDPFVTNALAVTVGAVTLIILSLIAGEPWSLPTQTATWISVIYLILFGSVVMFYLFLFVIRRWTASATSFQFVLMPFVTVIVAGLLAAEAVNSAFILGGALTLIGVWIGALSNSSAPKA